jgi:predicted phage baseplate assembly protein
MVTLSTPTGAARHHDLMWIRARVASGAYDIEPRIANVAVNVLRCSQQETVSDERLDDPGSVRAGRPNQRYTLARQALLVPPDAERSNDATFPDEPVIVAVAGERWERVDAFDASAPASRHFTLDADTGSICFGNGVNGRIPARGEEIRAESYRTCAGAAGNVAANQRWRFRREDLGAILRNSAAAVGGADPETLAELELRGQAALRRPERAVTSADIERVALATPHVHVARAKAIAHCPHPESITVVVLPKVRPRRARLSTHVSGAFRRAVERHLERHRLLCDELHVAAPVFVDVAVRARLRLVKGAGPAMVIARAREALDRFLRGDLDLTQPSAAAESAAAAPTPCPTRWPFGRAVMLSEIYAVLEGVRGVDTAWAVELDGRRDGAIVSRDAARGIPLPPTGLVVPGAHQIVVDDRRGARA